MNKKNISAEPGAALPAPLSPPGEAFVISREIITSRRGEFEIDNESQSRLKCRKALETVSVIDSGQISVRLHERYGINAGIEERFLEIRNQADEISRRLGKRNGKNDFQDAYESEIKDALFHIVNYPRTVGPGGEITIGLFHVFRDPPKSKPVAVKEDFVSSMVDEFEKGCIKSFKRKPAIEEVARQAKEYLSYVFGLREESRRPFDRLVDSLRDYLGKVARNNPKAKKIAIEARNAVGDIREAMQAYPNGDEAAIVQALIRFNDRIESALYYLPKKIKGKKKYLDHEQVPFYEAVFSRMAKDKRRDDIRSSIVSVLLEDKRFSTLKNEIFTRDANTIPDETKLKTVMTYFRNWRHEVHPEMIMRTNIGREDVLKCDE